MLIAFPPMSKVCFWGSSLIALLITTSTLAADKENQERSARKACLSGDYARGVEILSDLFLDTRNPTYIFNQARCYEQNNRCSEAVGRFREYLRKAPDLSVSEKTEVAKHIDECEKVLSLPRASTTPAPAAETAPPAPLSPPPGTAAPAAPAAPVAPAPALDVAPPAAQVATTAPPRQGHGLLIAGICTGVVGLGSVGVGLYYYDQARQYSDKEYTPANDKAGKHAETMQWVFYGIGGAVVAAGAVMTILGWPSSTPSAPATSFAPMVGPGLAGLAAQGYF
jgi:hypothetical protein